MEAVTRRLTSHPELDETLGTSVEGPTGQVNHTLLAPCHHGSPEVTQAHTCEATAVSQRYQRYLEGWLALGDTPTHLVVGHVLCALLLDPAKCLLLLG